MSNNRTVKRQLHDKHLSENSQDHANLKKLNIHKDLELRPELCSLHTMSDLMKSYRQEFLAARKEFKNLQESHSTSQLANMHVQHKLDCLDSRIRSCAENYSNLRHDYLIQRRCFIEQALSSENQA